MTTEADSGTDEFKERVGPVLGRTPSGVFILTASNGEELETGMLASWVQQASFDPPLVTVAVNRKRYLNDWLDKHPYMVLNLVGESQTEFLKQFGRGFEPDAPAFEGFEIGRAKNGLPTLAGALGYLEGKVRSRVEAGDSWVYLVEITSAGASELLESSGPMVHIRKNGFGY
jgi:flavin reductase (DIM6/NTAB) family NADH-FMN oxidoreductase RutF